MENQHRIIKIVNYLPKKFNLNEGKNLAEQVGYWLEKLKETQTNDQRWATKLKQTGFMLGYS